MSYGIRKLAIVQVMRGRQTTASRRRDAFNLSANVKMITVAQQACLF